MIVLLDNNRLDRAEKELDLPCEQLLTPLTRYKRVRKTDRFAIDNGCFAGFRKDAFFALLAREYENRELCRFVTVPDCVGSARRTLELFDHFRFDLLHWRLALAIQNGQEDLPIEWDAISAVFLGGDDTFKMSECALQILKTAKTLDKWVHVGRVNTPRRFEHFDGIADSIDGTGLVKFSDTRKKLKRYQTQGKLV